MGQREGKQSKAVLGVVVEMTEVIRSSLMNDLNPRSPSFDAASK
jgi:hypothetical protein